LCVQLSAAALLAAVPQASKVQILELKVGRQQALLRRRSVLQMTPCRLLGDYIKGLRAPPTSRTDMAAGLPPNCGVLATLSPPTRRDCQQPGLDDRRVLATGRTIACLGSFMTIPAMANTIEK
jgi:hypothetical protein